MKFSLRRIILDADSIQIYVENEQYSLGIHWIEDFIFTHMYTTQNSIEDFIKNERFIGGVHSWIVFIMNWTEIHCQKIGKVQRMNNFYQTFIRVSFSFFRETTALKTIGLMQEMNSL